MKQKLEHNEASDNSNLNKLVLSCLEYLIMESHSNGAEDILKILLQASTEIGETIINNTNTDSNDISHIKNFLTAFSNIDDKELKQKIAADIDILMSNKKQDITYN